MSGRGFASFAAASVGLVIAALLGTAGVSAQTARSGVSRLVVVVHDPSGAVIVGATVSVVAVERESMTVGSLPTGPDGSAVFDALRPGRVTIRASFAGFETVEMREVRLRDGSNRRVVTLPIRTVIEGVDADRDPQGGALDPGGSAFSTILTREQIDALPDDPEEMEAVLKAMAPPGAVIRIDGFSGGRLPPKSQIRSIRLPRSDEFAAENHGGMNGMMFIDVMTQPGNGPLGGSIDTTFRDAALNARNPFTPVKGIERLHQYGLSFSGPIRPGRSSFSVTAQAGRIRESGSVLAALPGQTQAEATIQPVNRSMILARFDQSLGTSHLLRGSYSRMTSERRNLGTGGYDLPDRAYATSAGEQTFRLSENGPIGRRAFSESRLQVRWTRSTSTSSFEQPTIRVLDAFTTGGAQQAGGRRELDVEAATDLDFVRGSHSYRAGLLLETGRYRTDARTNYLGTFTFSSLADYQAGRSSNYSRRIGDPVLEFSTVELGAYVQDDYRVLRSLLVSYGLRYETQSFMSDRHNWSPRATATWAPFRSGRTTLRFGWGRFTDWIGTGTYEQSLLVDGIRFQEISLTNPTYPDPGATGGARPSNRYVLDTDAALPASYGLNAGVSQTMGEFHLSATYARRRAWGLLRGRNVNPLVGGMRADPRFADIVAAAPDAGFGAHNVMVDASFGKPRWHRLFANANYGWSNGRTNTTGAFGRSPSNDVDTEWGPTAPRHRFGFNLSARIVRALGVSINMRGQSGAPYNVTSGQDRNGDGVFNDRPEGVGRNSARGAGHFDMGARLSYAFGFGGPARGGGGGAGIFIVRDGPGGAMPGGFDGGAEASRLRLEIYASAQNVTNHRNYIGYSGVLTSPFFGEPTNVLNPRKIELGARFSF